MKKKTIRMTIIIISIVFILLLVLALRAAILYFGNSVPNKDYFGDEYIQIIYLTSISDYITAKEVLQEADKALSTITSREAAKNDFGKLGYLCITDDEAATEKHELKFIAADFSGNKGYIWVKYSSEAYDKNGKVTFGSWDVLSRWKLEKKDGKWTVISIKEHP